MKHTPEPWYAVRRSMIGWQVRSSGAKNIYGKDAFVAQMQTGLPTAGASSSPSEEEAEANAKLVAKLPDMLKMLFGS